MRSCERSELLTCAEAAVAKRAARRASPRPVVWRVIIQYEDRTKYCAPALKVKTIYRFEKDFNAKMKSNANCTLQLHSVQKCHFSVHTKNKLTKNLHQKARNFQITCSDALHFVKLVAVGCMTQIFSLRISSPHTGPLNFYFSD